MARKIVDCRKFPSETNCSLTLIGEEEEVVRAAVEHAVSMHGYEDNEETRSKLRQSLEAEEAYQPGARV